MWQVPCRGRRQEEVGGGEAEQEAAGQQGGAEVQRPALVPGGQVRNYKWWKELGVYIHPNQYR